LGWNFWPHFGHSTRSKSTRLTRSGVILNPHFEQVLSSDALDFSASLETGQETAVARRNGNQVLSVVWL
jgi:hypothetical protein